MRRSTLRNHREHGGSSLLIVLLTSLILAGVIAVIIPTAQTSQQQGFGGVKETQLYVAAHNGLSIKRAELIVQNDHREREITMDATPPALAANPGVQRVTQDVVLELAAPELLWYRTCPRCGINNQSEYSNTSFQTVFYDFESCASLRGRSTQTEHGRKCLGANMTMLPVDLDAGALASERDRVTFN